MSTIQRFLKQQTPFPSLEQEVFVGLRLVSDRLLEPWERTLNERADLTAVQYNVLRVLRGAGAEGISAGELAGRLITRSPDVTRLVDRLENRRLVRRARNSGDRREVRIYLTDAGRDLIAPLDEPAVRILGETLGAIGEERLLALRDTLDAILEALERRGGT